MSHVQLLKQTIQLARKIVWHRLFLLIKPYSAKFRQGLFKFLGSGLKTKYLTKIVLFTLQATIAA